MTNYRRTIPGVNDVATMRPDIAALFSPRSPIQPQEVSVYNQKKALFVCERGHEWEARVATVSSGGRCVYCAGLRTWSGYNDLATKRPELIPYYSADNLVPVDECYYAGAKKLQWQCPDCEYRWTGQARNITTQPCPCCHSRVLVPGVNDFATKTPEAVELWSSRNRVHVSEVFPYENTVYWWQCARGHEWQTTPNKISTGSRCPTCAVMMYQSDGERAMAAYILQVFAPDVAHSQHTERATAAGVLLNDRTVLQGYELDVVIPALGIAFEYNGDYWHSADKLLTSYGMTAHEYHRWKWEQAQEAGIEVYYVWEWDWWNRREGVEDAVRSVIEQARYGLVSVAANDLHILQKWEGVRDQPTWYGE